MGHHKALMKGWLGPWFEQAAKYCVSVFSLAWRLPPCANKGPFNSTLTCKSAHSACSFPVFKQHLYMKNMSQYSPPFPLLCFRIRNGICGLTPPFKNKAIVAVLKEVWNASLIVNNCFIYLARVSMWNWEVPRSKHGTHSDIKAFSVLSGGQRADTSAWSNTCFSCNQPVIYCCTTDRPWDKAGTEEAGCQRIGPENL